MALTDIPGTDFKSAIGPGGQPVPIPPSQSGGSAASPSYVRSANYTPRGDQQIAIATLQSVTSLTVPSNATVAILQNNTTQAIRWRDSGSNPTTSLGQRIPAGGSFTYDGSLAALRLLAEAAGSGTLDIWYGS